MAKALAREAVAHLANEGLDFFTIEDLEARLGLTRPRARDLAYRLCKVNMAKRLNRGLYVLVPPADWQRRHALPANWYLAAAALAGQAPYFLAYYTAMELHRMIQHPLRTIFVAVNRQRAEIAVEQVRFRFITIKRDRFFGFEERAVEEGREVTIADLERTFIDCIDRPELCGGIEEVVRGFERRIDELEGDRLLRYVLRIDQPTLAKRLGFLLEVVGYREPTVLWELERIGGRLKRYIPLEKRRPPNGPRNKRWELILNTEVDRLLRALKT